MFGKQLDIVINEVKKIFVNDVSGHDYWHTMRVYQNALKIAKQEPCDIQIVSFAALLHDVDDVKLFKTVNYKNARAVMKIADINDSLAERVVSVIKKVSFREAERGVSVTMEGKVVQDADRLDAMGAIGIARTFAYGGSKGQCMHNPDIAPLLKKTMDCNHESQTTSINHFYEKLFHLKDLMNTETAKKIAEKKDAFMHSYIEAFLEEWNGI